MIIIIILMEHFNLLQVALSLVATCMVLKCYYDNPSVTEMPAWIRTIVLDWLAKIVRVKVPPGLIHVMEKHVKEQEEVREEIEYERRNSVLSQSMGHRDDRRFLPAGGILIRHFRGQKDVVAWNHELRQRLDFHSYLAALEACAGSTLSTKDSQSRTCIRPISLPP